MAPLSFKALGLALLGSALPSAFAQQGYYFVLEGGGMPVVLERVDPLLSAGQVPSQHVHSVVGGNAFTSTMTFATTQKSTCSTVSPKDDNSNYWMPNLYFHVPSNGSFIRVPEQPYHKIYYKYGNGANQLDTDIQEFPQEFKMITGSAIQRSENSTSMGPYGSGLGWACHGGNGYPDVDAVGFPKGFTECPNGLAAAITFPSCWNGQAFNPAAPAAHMAFPVADGISGCPTGYQVARFPQIFVEYWLDVTSFNGLYGPNDSPFVLAPGDPTGYAFHVDFINGWTPGVLNSIMKTCTPGNTGNPPLSDQTCFGRFKGTYTPAQMNACTTKPLDSENVGWTYGTVDGPNTRGGVLDKLPGCNPIQAGPGPATLQTC